jgi:hypothetical protein
VIRTRSVRDAGDPIVCDPVAVVLPEEHRSKYPEMLAIIEHYAASLGAAQIMLPSDFLFPIPVPTALPRIFPRLALGMALPSGQSWEASLSFSAHWSDFLL